MNWILGSRKRRVHLGPLRDGNVVLVSDPCCCEAARPPHAGERHSKHNEHNGQARTMYSLSPSITSVEDILLSAIAEGLSPWVPVAIAMLYQFAVGAFIGLAAGSFIGLVYKGIECVTFAADCAPGRWVVRWRQPFSHCRSHSAAKMPRPWTRKALRR